ncbi:GNAT family N-acetyltransferase [Roseisolibacter sp. H3M3-2]|uniref:GNAT family N-acetyltransferase n=1 Tax=Roseisolibacter sp. H3M3-2 TaxID=3031323 RepID=UPI0023DB9390|nr:GNAT family N-acetyltransferase [Roseisolibacter sp. H3M3-2]MDF1504428.1 GNAT family N-acetyltransferase [Roseisolibacter sp. H3M3-2]
MPDPLPDEFVLRLAGASDVRLIAEHRAAMWADMGQLHPDAVAAMVDETAARLGPALAEGRYVGWLLESAAHPGRVVAGAGVLLREQLPFPVDGGRAVRFGEQGLVINVYTDPAWRRRGLAERLMRALLAWAETRGLSSVILHASDDGRPLYERLGFRGTNEMRWSGLPRR